MWDKPRELNKLSGALLVISLVLVLYVALSHMVHLPAFALRAVQLTAVPQHVDAGQIEAVARNELRGNFFTVNLDEARQTFEKLPWVRKVNVRRQFPWRLEVSLEEHEALAIWNGDALVNTYGEVFKAESNQLLPSFTGLPDTAGEVARMYAAFSDLLRPLKQQITQISLSSRHAWQLHLDNGLLMKLGREQALQRLAHFVAVYPYSLAPVQRTVNYVDLRYHNGFAAHFSDTPGNQKKGGQDERAWHSKV